MAIVTTHVAAVQELYVAYFGRPADPAGLDYWTNIVEAQGSTAAVSATFAASPEYIVSYFGKTNAQVVDQIYTNLFGRTADAAGKAYWVNLLNNGTIKVDTIVAEVAAAALTTDAEIIENKVAAATAFTTAVDTPAEMAGYNGTDALALAKAFITGVTTDATLTAAINPSYLNAQVAAVVNAGTPFSLETAVAASAAAIEARDDFLEENDLTLATAATDLGADVDTAEGALVTGGVAGFAGARPTVQAALLAGVQADLDADLTEAQEALAEARADAGTAVLAVADNRAAATVAVADATKAAAEALRIQNAAELTVEARAGGRAVTITYDAVETTDVTSVTIVAAVATDPAVTLVRENAAGNLVLGTGVTETTYPGITALLDALRANQDAQLDLQASNLALSDANTDYAALSAADKLLADEVVTATTEVNNAEEAISDLAELVADWEEAVALEETYTELAADVTAANAAFTSNGYVAPRALSDVTTFASTSGSDIFLVGDEAAVTITSFGRSGNDAIFLGSDFVLNTGDLEDGNNAALEVFFVQNGTRAEIHVENAVFGSASDDVTVITLVGVNADDLQFTNGVVSVVPATGA